MRTFATAVLAAGIAALTSAASLPSQSVYPTGTTVWLQGRTDDGYTLFKAQGGFAVLIDMDGTVVNTWYHPLADHEVRTVQPLDSGHILAFSRYVPPVGRPEQRTVAEMDYDGNVVWSWTLPPSLPDAGFHHDLQRLPNGNTMLLGVQEILIPSISPKLLEDDFIVEVDPAGKVVWTWETWQHFDEFGFTDCQKEQIAKDGGDWAHANTISVIPPNTHTDPAFAEGNVILSYRFTNTIAIVDKVTGQIVWRLGPDPENYTWGQHQPHMIELGLPGEGNILVFDNGSGTGYCSERRATGMSRIYEIDPRSNDIIWRYGEGMRFWSNIISGCQRLSNGNTLICSGVRGRLFEVETDGTIVWEYMSPYFIEQGLGKDHRVYRAYRLPYDWVP